MAKYNEEKIPGCKKCGRQIRPVKILREDKKTKKKWLISTCPKCDFEGDLEPFIKDYKIND